MRDLYAASLARTSFTLVLLGVAGAMALALVEEADRERPVELLGRDLLRVVREKRGIPVAISRGVEK